MSDGRPPVIIIGMHRSGTSLLTRALQHGGFFMGRGATRNEEAAFTNAVNAWIFGQASATWDRPESMDLLLADHELRPWLVDYMEGLVRGPAALRFLGMRRWLSCRGMHRLRVPWGWKDPRNTYTLPLWLELFPDARVLHIVRHGVDVTESLRTRRDATFRGNVARYRRRRALYVSQPWAPKRRGFGPQVRCRTLEGGFSLWEAYVARARAQLGPLGARAREISYESLLTRPREELRGAFEFCGVATDSEAIDAAASRVDSRRARAYRNSPELIRFAERMEDRLAFLGYGASPP